MRLRINRACTLVVLCLGQYTFSANFVFGDLSPETVRKEYLGALPLLENRFEHCIGSGLSTIHSVRKNIDPNTVDVQRAWIDFSRSGPRGKFVRTLLASVKPTIANFDLSASRAEASASTDSQVVRAYNSDYSFNLDRKSSGFVIESLEAGFKAGQRQFRVSPAHAAMAATSLHQNPVSTVLGSKLFHLDRVTPVAGGTGSRLKLEFSLEKRPLPTNNAIQLNSGWLVVSPEEQWVLHEFSLLKTYPNSEQTTEFGRTDYQRELDGTLRPSHTDYRLYTGRYDADPMTSGSAVAPDSRAQFFFSDFRFGDAPQREFTLTGYGLPEFGQTVKQVEAGRSFPWWLVGVAVGFAALAVVLRRLGRRGTPAATGAG